MTSIKYHYDGCKVLMYYMGKLMREKEDLVYKLDRGWLGGGSRYPSSLS